MSTIFKDKISRLGLSGFFSLGTLELTSRCNVSCKYCYVDPVCTELTTEQVLSTVDRLADAGVLSIMLTGGEVFLRSDIIEILEHIFKRDFFQTLILSNGTLLKRHHIDFLARHNRYIGFIRFSFFSHHASVHDAFTGLPGAFEKTLANADTLKKRGLNVGVTINLLEENLTTLDETKAFFSSRGFLVEVSLVKIIPNSRVGAYCTPLMSKAFYKRYFDQCTDKAKVALRESFEERAKKTVTHLCERMFASIAILSDGRIVSCVAFRGNELGNVLTDERPLQQIVQNAPLIKYLRSLSRKDIAACSSCQFINHCMLCPGMMYSENSSYTIPSPQTCNYMQELYETINAQP